MLKLAKVLLVVEPTSRRFEIPSALRGSRVLHARYACFAALWRWFAAESVDDLWLEVSFDSWQRRLRVHATTSEVNGIAPLIPSEEHFVCLVRVWQTVVPPLAAIPQRRMTDGVALALWRAPRLLTRRCIPRWLRAGDSKGCLPCVTGGHLYFGL